MVTNLFRASAMSTKPCAVVPFWSQTIVCSVVLICNAFASIRAPASPIPLPLATRNTQVTTGNGKYTGYH